MKVFSLSLCVLFLSSCSNFKCREVNTLKKMDIKKPEKTVWVYKADGSLQCGQGASIELTETAKELKEIAIYSSEKMNDGLMHISVCGSPTGRVNAFEIDLNDLKAAMSQGFKKKD